jgi:diphthamide biosynthesis methyltransferase
VLQWPGVATQNLTLKLPVETVRRAKVVAAERGTSISALVTEKIDELVGEDAEYQAAKRRAFEWLKQGWHLGRR